jgi:hypothetical protein
MATTAPRIWTIQSLAVFGLPKLNMGHGSSPAYLAKTSSAFKLGFLISERKKAAGFGKKPAAR